MIIGNIHELAKVKKKMDPHLFAILEKAAGMDLQTLADIKHIGDATVKVVTFTTKKRWYCKPERHKRHIDIIIEAKSDGDEWFGMLPVKYAGDLLHEEPERDFYYYNTEFETTFVEHTFILKPGEFAVFFTDEIHRPGWHRDKPAHVTKVIIKVPCEPKEE